MSRHSRGFTLIELIVVVGIILVLMALLAPALFKARDYSRNAACLSNLHQVGAAFANYANDGSNTKRSLFPVGYNSTTGHNYASVMIELGYLNSPKTNVGAVSTANVLRCPNSLDNPGSLGAVNASPVPTASGLNGYWENTVSEPLNPTVRHYRTWYGYNGGTTGDAPLPDTDGTTLPQISRDKYANCNNLVLIFDGYLTANGAGGASAIPYAARHSGSSATNILCADGHGDTIPVTKMPQGAFTAIQAGTPGPQWRLSQVQ